MRHSQNRALAFSMERRLGQARFVGRNAANRDFRETPLPALPTNKQRQRNRQVLHINGFGVFHQFLRRARFLMTTNSEASEGESAPVTVVLNWAAGVKK